MKFKIIMAFIVIGLSMPAMAASDFYINVKVISHDAGKRSTGSGGFWVGQGEFGRVGITFGDDPTNFVIKALGGKQGPISQSLAENGQFVMDDGKPWLLADIYLKASLNPDNTIHVNGMLTKMVRALDSEPPLYTHGEQQLEFNIVKSGQEDFTLYPLTEGKQIDLEITARRSDETIVPPEKGRYLTIHEDYSLIDISTGKVHMSGQCALGYGGDNTDESQGTCAFQFIIPLADGDSLLYITLSDFKDVQYNPDNTVTFTLDISHMYLLNPENYSPDAAELRSERTTMVNFSKTITVGPSGQTEIEIPADKDNPLPFKAKEQLVLTTEVGD